MKLDWWYVSPLPRCFPHQKPFVETQREKGVSTFLDQLQQDLLMSMLTQEIPLRILTIVEQLEHQLWVLLDCTSWDDQIYNSVQICRFHNENKICTTVLPVYNKKQVL